MSEKRRLFSFKGLLTRQGWITPAYVEVDSKGVVLSIFSEKPKDQRVSGEVAGWALPPFVNGHSHAFQYAMVGSTECLTRGHTSDDFWTWRDRMYQVALKVSPDHLLRIATQLYSEMIRVGYGWVVEFHYLHHDRDGKPYPNLSELGRVLIEAAKRVGIGMTMIPVYYSQGGFGKRAEAKQRRFLFSSVEPYLRLQEELALFAGPRVATGWSVHSLRAALPEEIDEIIKVAPRDRPFHIHMAEQVGEVNECQRVYGRRPVEWFFENVERKERLSFVHATHVNASECQLMVDHGVHVVVCPSTEGNLGDGFFPMRPFWESGGHWTIGTDSHVGLGPFEELRWLDYASRLKRLKRDTFCLTEDHDGGREMFFEAILSGHRSAGLIENRDTEEFDFFQVGRSFDALVVDAGEPLLADLSKPYGLSTLIYGFDSRAILGMILEGRWRYHREDEGERESIRSQFREVLAELSLLDF